MRATALHSGFSCDACHITPKLLNDKGHIDSALPAEVTFGKLATGDLRNPVLGLKPLWDKNTQKCTNTYCHDRPDGGHPPLTWNVKLTQPLVCGSCHGLPPKKIADGRNHPASGLANCIGCHKTASAAGQIAKPNLHMNGVVDP